MQNTGQPTEKSSGFLKDIESLRGLLALTVAVGHSLSLFLFEGDHSLFSFRTLRDICLKLTEGLINGQTAVTAFFIISGFVLSLSLEARNYHTSARNYILFFARRVARLYPAHIVATCLFIIVGLYGVYTTDIDFSWNHLLANSASFLNGAAFHSLGLSSFLSTISMYDWSLNPVAWSLYAEMTAAFFIPFFFVIHKSANRTTDLFFIAALFGLTYYSWGPAWVKYLFVFYMGMTVPTRGSELIEWLSRCIKNPNLLLLLIYASMVLPAMLVPGRPAGVLLFEAIGSFCLISFIVYGSAANVLTKFLRHPVMRWNGRISYSFYLYHYFILVAFIRFVVTQYGGQYMLDHSLLLVVSAVFTTIPLALLCGHLSYHFIESPALRLSKKIFPIQ